MTHYRRVRTGNTFFFTLVACHGQPILCHPTIRDALRRALHNVRQTCPFAIDGWVLLPDHLHCIWTLPDETAECAAQWTLLKRAVARFSRDVALEHRQPTIWQRRFRQHRIRDDTDFERHLDYLHFDPVRHGHAGWAIEWPYSTLHRYVKAGLYASDWRGGAAPDEVMPHRW